MDFVSVCQHMLSLVLISHLLTVTVATLSKGQKKKKAQATEYSSQNVFDRDLVTEDIKIKDVLREYKAYCDVEKEIKRFPGKTLAYVTPWNNHGYTIAKRFSQKFSYVSPVWLQIKRKPGGAFVIQGTHDVDHGWVDEVTAGKHAKMLPRVFFDGWNGKDYGALFSSEDTMEDCIQVILDFIKQNKFAGVVIEIWSQLGGQANNGVIGMFTREDFEALENNVDGFSLMTYDFSSQRKPGANSPIAWVKDCIEALVPEEDSPSRSKILLGLNFYGNDYTMVKGGNGGAIVGSQYIDILKKFKPKLQWVEETAEHVGEYKANVTVTDLPEFLPLMNLNIETNQHHITGTATAESLKWGEESLRRTVDCVLMADCIYYDKSLGPLVETVCSLCSDKTVVFCCYEQRTTGNKPELERKFLQLMLEKFDVEDIPLERQDSLFRSEDILIKRFWKKTLTEVG